MIKPDMWDDEGGFWRPADEHSIDSYCKTCGRDIVQHTGGDWLHNDLAEYKINDHHEAKPVSLNEEDAINQFKLEEESRSINEHFDQIMAQDRFNIKKRYGNQELRWTAVPLSKNQWRRGGGPQDWGRGWTHLGLPPRGNPDV